MVWLLPPGKESSERERERMGRGGRRVFAFCLGLFGSGNNVWEERRREEEGRRERGVLKGPSFSPRFGRICIAVREWAKDNSPLLFRCVRDDVENELPSIKPSVKDETDRLFFIRYFD